MVFIAIRTTNRYELRTKSAQREPPAVCWTPFDSYYTCRRFFFFLHWFKSKIVWFIFMNFGCCFFGTSFWHHSQNRNNIYYLQKTKTIHKPVRRCNTKFEYGLIRRIYEAKDNTGIRTNDEMGVHADEMATRHPYTKILKYLFVIYSSLAQWFIDYRWIIYSLKCFIHLLLIISLTLCRTDRSRYMPNVSAMIFGRRRCHTARSLRPRMLDK